ncbi:MAG TPA: N-formylglutamate amidohydrolase [Clostridiales bacterium]|nr:N-formylglutamate amidohydrolase [Clostridiales bacterium]
MEKIIIHIPHSSTVIPEEYRGLFFLNNDELADEILRMTDRYTDDLFGSFGHKIIFPISRLVCDVERFRSEKQESMTGKGMWVCYERTSDQRTLKTVSVEHKKEILENWYDIHHKKLTLMSERALRLCNQCLIVDAHSFPSKALSYENTRRNRPDICLGTDEYHTPTGLIRQCADLFSALGYRVAVNIPFAGCLIPMKYYRKDQRVAGIMIEINRSLYMDENTGIKSEGYLTVKEDITAVLRDLIHFNT